MPNERILTKNLILNRKHNERKRTVTTARNKARFARFLEKTVKRVVLQNATNARDSLSRKHIVGDDNRVVLTKIMGQSIGIKQKTKCENKNGLLARIFPKRRRIKRFLTNSLRIIRFVRYGSGWATQRFFIFF